MEDGRATGTDEILAETLKAWDNHSIHLVTDVGNIMYKNEYMK